MANPQLALCLVCLATLFACKGSEPGASDAKAEAKPAEAKSVEAKADSAAPVAATAGAASADGGGETSGGETGGGETETGGDGDEAGVVLPESFEKLDVEVCDQYVADYVACIDSKAPEAEREKQRRIVFKNLEAWKKMKTSGPSAQQGLQIGCRSAREQAKRETQAWACEW